MMEKDVLCRLCLEPHDLLINLFSIKDKNVQVLQRIEEVLQISVCIKIIHNDLLSSK